MQSIEYLFAILGLGLAGLGLAVIISDGLIAPLIERWHRRRRRMATYTRQDMTSEYLETVDRR